MPDEVQPPAAATAQAPAQPEVPSQTGAIDPQELATLRRNSERLRGMERFVTEARSLGLKGPDDLGRWRKFNETLGKHKLTMEQLVAALETPDTPAPHGGPDLSGYLRREDAEQLLSERLGRELSFRDARAAHEAALKADEDRIAAFVKESLGSSAPRHAVEDAMDLLRYRADRARRADGNVYEDGHALATFDWKPLGETGLKGLFESFKKARTVAEGAEARTVGAQASQSVGSSTPAGASQGTPTRRDTDKSTRGRPSQTDLEKAVDERMARRKGNPVSSVGG